MANSLPTKETMDASGRTLDGQVKLTALTLMVVVTGSFKIMFFVRVYEGIGWIVELVA